MIKEWKESNKKSKQNENDSSENDGNNTNADVLSSLPANVVDALQEETVHDIMTLDTMDQHI